MCIPSKFPALPSPPYRDGDNEGEEQVPQLEELEDLGLEKAGEREESGDNSSEEADSVEEVVRRYHEDVRPMRRSGRRGRRAASGHGRPYGAVSAMNRHPRRSSSQTTRSPPYEEHAGERNPTSFGPFSFPALKHPIQPLPFLTLILRRASQAHVPTPPPCGESRTTSSGPLDLATANGALA
ncbi:hypothetical protein X777_06704 [Ooceraea biroi]|uniref:Uncharacterized protein n=1 Tax=Ooceraea biroi TaxID=2015173 RepID=A0A026WCN0_OOCBI|nr:hypothetical protein X777_06704 [Ooceraea biroi]